MSNEEPNSNLNIDSIKQNMDLDFKVLPSDKWTSARTLSRAGKATGKNRYWWNIEESNGQQKSVDLSSVSHLRINTPIGPNQETDKETQNLVDSLASLSLYNNHHGEEIQVHKTLITKTISDIEQAKCRELNEWKKECVYLEEEDIGQDCIS